ncbi:MAG: hypothetical protein ACKN9V_01850 [Pseudomonadota bacterium]
MKLQKATVAIAVVFGCGAMSSSTLAADDHQRSEKARTKTVAGKSGGWKESYQELIDALDSKKAGKSVVQSCGDAALADEDKAVELKSHFETVFKYREALNSCKDNLHGKLKSFFDDYIAQMKLESKNPSSLKENEKPEKSLQGMDSALRFHEHMKKFLEEKATTLKASKEKFAEADSELLKAINGIYALCVAKDFKPSDDAKTTQKIDEFNNQVKKLGIKNENACELNLEDAVAAPAPDTDSDTTDEGTTAPPVQENSSTAPGKPTDPSAGTGALSGPQSNVLPISPGLVAPIQQGNSAAFDPNNLQNQLEQDQLERQQLIDTLQQAAREATRANRVGGSPDNSRSFQFPPVSVQPNPQNPYQQQQNPQQMQQPYPPYPMMPQQPMVQSAITPELLAALRSSDNANRPSPAAAAQAAQTQSLMEMARLQQQLMQAQMANNMQMNNPYNQNGMAPNISRLRRNRTAFRGTRGTAGSRFMSRATRTVRSLR